MNAQRDEHENASGAIMRFYDWINDKLLPIIGPPDTGPYGPVIERVNQAVCPICESPMADHFFDRSSPDVVLYCPKDEADHASDRAPLDGWGRVKAG